MDDYRKIARKLERDGEPDLFGPISTGDLVAKRLVANKPSRRTERGDLLTYFHSRIRNKKGKPFPMAFMATKLSHLTIPNLYYLKSVCDSESGRTFEDKVTHNTVQVTFGMVFWKELRPK